VAAVGLGHLGVLKRIGAVKLGDLKRAPGGAS
jgi:hypothetical protein